MATATPSLLKVDVYLFLQKLILEAKTLITAVSFISGSASTDHSLRTNQERVFFVLFLISL